VKYDGWRALAHIQNGSAQLISRNGNRFKSFSKLETNIAAAVSGNTVLDGEILCLDSAGRPQFYELMRRREPQYFYAFDVLSLDGEDLRGLPLLGRKHMLRRLCRGPVLYVDHIATAGSELFRAACEHDLEGIVAKHAEAPYGLDGSWIKIKNRAYTQAVGRHDFFDRRRAAAAE
jgi:bifunctional non-homologous end joining protein LigD